MLAESKEPHDFPLVFSLFFIQYWSDLGNVHEHLEHSLIYVGRVYHF